MQISYLLSKSLCSEIFPKKEFFWKRYSIGHISKVMTFFEQIYIMVLLIQQVLLHKKDGLMSFFGLNWLYCLYAKINTVEKTIPCD